MSADGVAPWTDAQREMGWIVISGARRNLRLSISPCIASAFIILHRYFRTKARRSHKLYLLLVSALFLACKMEDTYRSLVTIFQEIAGCLVKVEEKLTKEKEMELFGERDFSKPDITDEEINEIGVIELELLNALDWKLDIELPFSYFNEIKPVLGELVAKYGDRVERLFDVGLRNLCLIVRSEEYLDIPPAVSAAVSVENSFKRLQLPEKITEWINAQKRTSPEAYLVASQIITTNAPCCVRLS